MDSTAGAVVLVAGERSDPEAINALAPGLLGLAGSSVGVEHLGQAQLRAFYPDATGG